MKNKYEILSDRYNYKHSFIKTDNDFYIFKSQEDWMSLRVIYNEERKSTPSLIL